MKTYIIAEAGVNHNGQIILAKKLIDEAVKIGSDAIKFQFFDSSQLASAGTKKASYQIKNSKSNYSFYSWVLFSLQSWSLKYNNWSRSLAY